MSVSQLFLVYYLCSKECQLNSRTGHVQPTWGLKIRSQLDLKLDLKVASLCRKEKGHDEKAAQADVLVFASDVTFFIQVWAQENQHHHHWCQRVEWAPGPFGAGMPQPLLMCQQSPQWDRQSTTQSKASKEQAERHRLFLAPTLIFVELITSDRCSWSQFFWRAAPPFLLYHTNLPQGGIIKMCS